MCLSVCCVNTGDQEEPMEKKTQRDKLTLSRNLLVLLFGERPDWGKGVKQHTGPNPSYSYSPVHRLGGSTCKMKNKKKTIKVHKNGLKFNYCVVYTCG